jgi:hypothetical protein
VDGKSTGRAGKVLERRAGTHLKATPDANAGMLHPAKFMLIQFKVNRYSIADREGSVGVGCHECIALLETYAAAKRDYRDALEWSGLSGDSSAYIITATNRATRTRKAVGEARSAFTRHRALIHPVNTG